MQCSRFHRAVCVLTVFLALPLAGCRVDPECEPPITDQITPVAEADLSVIWSDPSATGFRIVVTTGPYRLTDFAVERLIRVMSQQAGLEVEVVVGVDTGLPAGGALDWRDVMAAGRAQIPEDDTATLVVVVVDATDYRGATYGFIHWQNGDPTWAVMVVHRGAADRFPLSLVPRTWIETPTVLHEVGHWLGVPGRDFHTSTIDGNHCTDARCVMFKGSRINTCAVLTGLRHGLPTTFCPACAEELAELERRRQITTD